MKRSDLDTITLLTTVDYWGTSAWLRLRDRYPPKLIRSAIERDCRRGLLDYGVAAERPWLTEKGRMRLAGIVVPTV